MMAAGEDSEAATLLARAALGYAWRWAGGSVNQRVVAVLEEALAALDPTDAVLRPLLLARLSVEFRYGHSTDQRLALAREAVELARDGDNPHTLIAALMAEHAALDAPADLTHRLAIATEVAAIAERENDARTAVEAAYWRIPDLLTTADVAGLDAQIEREARLAEQLRQPYYLWIAALHRCMNALRAGSLEEAERLAEDALALGHQIEPDAAERWHAIQVYAARKDQDRLAEIVELLDRFAERFGSIAGARAMRAEALLAAGREDDARVVLSELAADRYAAVGRDVNWLGSASPLAALCATLADAPAAKTLYELLRPSAGMVAVLGPALAMVGAIDHHLGVLAATAATGGDAHLWDAAVQHLEAALVLHERLAAPPWLARTRCELAAVLLARRREPERARALLDAARTVAADLSLGGVLTRVGALAGRAGPAPAPRPRYPDGLTAREVDVLRLIAAGLTNREIASALVLGVTTVERHITNLYTKIDARGRADATAYAFRHALAESRPDA
jgi:DNA-binding CsgD family transcriptional regulator